MLRSVYRESRFVMHCHPILVNVPFEEVQIGCIHVLEVIQYPF